MHARGDKPGEMRHIHHQQGADLVANRPKGAEIDDARIRRAPGDDQLRLMLTRKPSNFLHVDPVVVTANAIRHRLEPFSRHVDR